MAQLKGTYGKVFDPTRVESIETILVDEDVSRTVAYVVMTMRSGATIQWDIFPTLADEPIPTGVSNDDYYGQQADECAEKAASLAEHLFEYVNDYSHLRR